MKTLVFSFEDDEVLVRDCNIKQYWEQLSQIV